jgi:hypothetical protein
MFNVKETVKLHSTSDPELDGKIATVEGFHGKDGIIVLFVPPRPLGYNPAIVIAKHCLKRN